MRGVWAAKGLVDVVGVENVASSLDLVAVPLTFVNDLFASELVALEHLDGVDVRDLQVVSRHSVLQQARGEHHTVPTEPELGFVLTVHVDLVSGAFVLDSAD